MTKAYIIVMGKVDCMRSRDVTQSRFLVINLSAWNQYYRPSCILVRTSPSGLRYSIFIAIFIFYYLDFYFLLLYLFFIM